MRCSRSGKPARPATLRRRRAPRRGSHPVRRVAPPRRRGRGSARRCPHSLGRLLRLERVPCRAVDVAQPELRERDAGERERFEPRVVGSTRVLQTVLEVRERVGEMQPEPVDDGERVERPRRTRLVLADGRPDRDGVLRELTPTLEVALQPERCPPTAPGDGPGARGRRDRRAPTRAARARTGAAEAAGRELGPGAIGERLRVTAGSDAFRYAASARSRNVRLGTGSLLR